MKMALTELHKKTAEAIINIFETGRVRGRYGAVGVIKGDTGHLSYGRSQVSLGSGNLYLLLKAYCESPGAAMGRSFVPLLPRFRSKDVTLDFDNGVRALLAQAGDDPVMQKAQDDYLDQNYWQTALKAATACRLTKPLSVAVIYDSHIQGGFGRIRDRVAAGPCVTSACPEDAWVKAYIDARRQWLSSCNAPLPTTVYRVGEFAKLVDSNPDLALPLTIRGVVINEDVLGFEDTDAVPSRVPEPSTTRPILQLTRPYMRGDDVKALQSALVQQGFSGDTDGCFGPMTATLVRQFQAKRGLTADGVVGPTTWQELEVRAAATTA
jgi:chitosanase